MKCSKCGKRFNSLPAIAKHYWKKHPAAMKRKIKMTARASASGPPGFCKYCGKSLG